MSKSHNCSTPVRVMRFSQRGRTSRPHGSMEGRQNSPGTLPKSMPAYTAAPSATASSGSGPSVDAMPDASATSRCTAGMRLAPPTIATRVMRRGGGSYRLDGPGEGVGAFPAALATLGERSAVAARRSCRPGAADSRFWLNSCCAADVPPRAAAGLEPVDMHFLSERSGSN